MKCCSMILISSVALGQSSRFISSGVTTTTRVWNKFEHRSSIVSFCISSGTRSSYSGVRRSAYANDNFQGESYSTSSSSSIYPWRTRSSQDNNHRSITPLTFQQHYHKAIHNKILGSTKLRMSSTDTSSDVALNLEDVKQRIKTVLEECPDKNQRNVRLIAVSKTKPIEMIKDAYEAGQRYFGENYAQELISKAEELYSTGSEYSDICWHFIGPLQSNKASSLVKKVGKQLTCVETVSTIKLANKLNNAVESLGLGDDDYKLNIYLQVNTSGEESKSGLLPNEIGDMAKEIQESCPYLVIKGVMTIGAPGDYNCFDILVECRNQLAIALNIDDPTILELSMGMSNDFEEAIKRGSTNVRIGSTIFGARDYSNLSK